MEYLEAYTEKMRALLEEYSEIVVSKIDRKFGIKPIPPSFNEIKSGEIISPILHFLDLNMPSHTHKIESSARLFYSIGEAFSTLVPLDGIPTNIAGEISATLAVMSIIADYLADELNEKAALDSLAKMLDEILWGEPSQESTRVPLLDRIIQPLIKIRDIINGKGTVIYRIFLSKTKRTVIFFKISSICSNDLNIYSADWILDKARLPIENIFAAIASISEGMPYESYERVSRKLRRGFSLFALLDDLADLPRDLVKGECNYILSHFKENGLVRGCGMRNGLSVLTEIANDYIDLVRGLLDYYFSEYLNIIDDLFRSNTDIRNFFKYIVYLEIKNSLKNMNSISSEL